MTLEKKKKMLHITSIVVHILAIIISLFYSNLFGTLWVIASFFWYLNYYEVLDKNVTNKSY
jgi:hypothetical protein